jgi:hypothetical protein
VAGFLIRTADDAPEHSEPRFLPSVPDSSLRI